MHTGMLSTATGAAVFSRLDDGATYTTVKLRVNSIQSERFDGSRLACEANPVHVGRTTIAKREVTDDTGHSIANCSTTNRVLPQQL
ncbi:hypothetical protein AB0C34_06205 [Nocardia sp. NPDC049220]|uniref:PaaI family thioesterase n=1 Tax=Nocardia sp. NPDC049220 TaxID=3155273 RepID=UPI00340C64C6